jgi:uncharacterized protein (DUF362 family)
MGFWDFFRSSKPEQFKMTETMWGYVSGDAATCPDGYTEGKREGNKLEYEVTMHVKNFKEFKAPHARKAEMTGWVSCRNLFGERLEMRNGIYGLYVIDQPTGQRRITYTFDFTDEKGDDYRFKGHKVIASDRGTLDLLEDQTTLFAEITKLDGNGSDVVARGIIHYHIEDFPAMLASIRTPGDDRLLNRLNMTRKFFDFVNKEIGEYFRTVNPFYTATYRNLVCHGVAEAGGKEVEFFMFSGSHDKGFPWGDTVSFADVALVLRDGDTWKRFALTDESLDILDLKVTTAEGTYSYGGPIYEITDGNQVSFTEIHQDQLPQHLRKVDAQLSLRFKSKKVAAKSVPFSVDTEKFPWLPEEVKKEVEKSRFYKHLKDKQKESSALGYSTDMYRLTGIEGDFTVGGTRYSVKPDKTLGEGEDGTIKGMRMPALYYNYFCAIESDQDEFRVQVRSGVLRSPTSDVLVSEGEMILGKMIGQMNRFDFRVRGETSEEIPQGEADQLMVPLEDLLEINNDHFHTATFQRRIVALPSTTGTRALALEEDMSSVSLDPIRSEETSTVAAIKDPDRFKALDRVLEVTRFMEVLDEALKKSGKPKEKFSIIVKPNFSFMYSLVDRATFTDPDLVEHLIDRIYEAGYRNIAVAEAHSTYTVLFTNRDIPTLARYIGLKGKNYRVIDLSEGTEPYDYGGKLGTHPAHPEWRDADFRISFAKNKTHSYAFYTLTIKNIYGALPMKNKFKEYHCNKSRGIFTPTIDFIEKFPIHFALIDGYISADGAFGIFADVEPNFTHTIIGGDSIVAVDWVGASKMGYDPMISEYMTEAVQRFGKPGIRLIGDHSTYPGWRNVPHIISKLAFGGMDRDYLMGDFLYSVMATMDPFFRFKPTESSRKVARFLAQPVRKVLFEWVHGDKDKLTRKDLEGLFDPKEWQYMERVLKSAFDLD